MTEQQREYHANWRNTHREHLRDYQKKYRQTERAKQRHREDQRKRYKANRERLIREQGKYNQTEEHRRYMREYTHRHNQQLKERVLGHYSNGQPKCAECGIVDLRILSLDHINNNGYQHRAKIGSGYSVYRWIEKNNYPPNFQCLCMNCQWIKRAEREEEQRGEQWK